MKLVLASSSPRRRDLLTEAGIDFEILVPEIDETIPPGECPWASAERLAREKAGAVSHLRPDQIVLAADTIVVCDEHILGKPASEADARRMLALLSGREHHVLTGVCLERLQPAKRLCWVCDTRVVFRDLTADTIARYMDLVQVMDKAGSYAIQEHGEMIVAETDGLLSNVIGLPIEEVVERLREFG